MKRIIQVNYDELNIISKKFQEEAENFSHLLAGTRQKMTALHNQWAGKAAEKFFEEMETELLPAVQRLEQSLQVSSEVLNQVMLTFYEADRETAIYFKDEVVEPYLLNLNKELASELLWKEYPTDQRSSVYREFWDTSESDTDTTSKEKD